MLKKILLIMLMVLGWMIGTVFANSITNIEEKDIGKTIDFSGYEWNVVDSKENKNGVGGNYWSKDNAFVDKNGYLHLKITKVGSEWKSVEIFTTKCFGYGIYQVEIAGPIDTSNVRTVASMFVYPIREDEKLSTYGGKSEIESDKIDLIRRIRDNNEIDIEFSQWDPVGINTINEKNAGFAIQANFPETDKKKRDKDNFKDSLGMSKHKYVMPKYQGDSIHGFTWEKDDITFTSQYGKKKETWVYHAREHEDRRVDPFWHKEYNQSTAQEEREGKMFMRVYMNLYLYKNDIEINNKEIQKYKESQYKEEEIVIKKFTYTPLPEAK